MFYDENFNQPKKKELKFPHTGSRFIGKSVLSCLLKNQSLLPAPSQPFAQQQACGICSKPDERCWSSLKSKRLKLGFWSPLFEASASQPPFWFLFLLCWHLRQLCLFFLIWFFDFTILYWFCHISKWIRHRYTCVPHPEPCFPLLPIPSLWVVPVHQPQASSIVHWTWTGDSFHIIPVLKGKKINSCCL